MSVQKKRRHYRVVQIHIMETSLQTPKICECLMVRIHKKRYPWPGLECPPLEEEGIGCDTASERKAR